MSGPACATPSHCCPYVCVRVCKHQDTRVHGHAPRGSRRKGGIGAGQRGSHTRESRHPAWTRSRSCCRRERRGVSSREPDLLAQPSRLQKIDGGVGKSVAPSPQPESQPPVLRPAGGPALQPRRDGEPGVAAVVTVALANGTRRRRRPVTVRTFCHAVGRGPPADADDRGVCGGGAHSA